MTTEQRLERLERENRWMRRIGMVAAAVAAAVFLIGQGKDKERQDLEVRSLTATKLTVKARDGKGRVTLGPNRFGGMSLNVWGNADDVMHIVFATGPDGTPHLHPWVRSVTVTDGTEKRAELDVDSKCASLRLYDKAGQSRATLFADFEDQTTLFFEDKAGNPKFELSVNADGVPTLGLWNNTGGGIYLNADSDGTACMYLTDKDGKTRASLSTKADGSSFLTFFDKDGKVIWKAPKD